MNSIMIVEDNIDTRTGLSNIVKDIDKNMMILETGSAEEALSLAKSQSIDVFILDVELEDYSGYELAEKLREIDKYKFTQIIFVTGFVDYKLDAYVKLNCYKYITKPYNRQDVETAVGEVIKFGISRKTVSDKLSFKRNGIVYPIELGKILFISYSGRKLSVITKKEVLEFSGYTLTKVIEKLPSEYIRCHKSYIINVNFVKNYDLANNIVNLDEYDIPIGRKYRKNMEESVL